MLLTVLDSETVGTFVHIVKLVDVSGQMSFFILIIFSSSVIIKLNNFLCQLLSQICVCVFVLRLFESILLQSLQIK